MGRVDVPFAVEVFFGDFVLLHYLVCDYSGPPSQQINFLVAYKLLRIPTHTLQQKRVQFTPHVVYCTG